MPKQPFLSDEWYELVDELVADHEPGTKPAVEMVMNLTITDSPFGAERLLHLSTRDGAARWGVGHAENPDTSITTDYATAKQVFVDANVQVGIDAFTTGKVRVQGDLTKLLTLFGPAGVGSGSALYLAIQDVTE